MICPKCGSEAPDGASFCTKCGAALNAGGAQENPNAQQGNPNVQQGMPNMQQGNPNAQQGNPNMQQGMPYGGTYGMPQQVYVDPRDHTREFDGKDISENKVIAMAPYLLGVLGIIIALLASKESPYVAFHVRQALKLTVCNVLIGICSVVLFFTLIVPFAGAVCGLIILVVRIICFFQIAMGKAKEAPIVCYFGFLK